MSSILLALVLGLPACSETARKPATESPLEQVRLILEAEELLGMEPVTVTASRCERSAGDIHCFYSEGDYWWPDTISPDGPYIRRDGMTNPGNFVDHRQAMRSFSSDVAALTAAFKLTDDERYAAHAVKHLRAWFVDAATFMRPHLLYSQAIKGRDTGRYIGVIDGIHLIEVSRSIQVLTEKGYLKGQKLDDIKTWFDQYLN
ncbi:MAG: alginate lyase family protein, partial [Saprospiraceae bacterium]|nr:alginate lyase family protein [Saprospiraceae bacterium]